jgi:O-6-methylguanine DNA methyltransferase
MVKIVSELETDFPGRHFTLDGHLVGSIGEVAAAYYYGIKLYPPSAKTHDGEIGGRKVQIKTTQRGSVLIKYEPEYLIVLYLSVEGEIYEVYNGSGKKAMSIASKPDASGNRRLSITGLCNIDSTNSDNERVQQIHAIQKYHLQETGKSGSNNRKDGGFYEKVYDAVRRIPIGKVTTYGQIAATAGSPGAGQSVGNALHNNPDPDTIPCHRVVNAKGELAQGFAFGGAEGQAKLLEKEGVVVIEGKVDLRCDGIKGGFDESD